MSASGDLLRQLYPQYAGSELVELHLQIAASLHTAAAWGGAYQLAMVHYAAHALMISDADAAAVAEGGNAAASTGQAAGLRSVTTGALSESYATPTESGAASLGLDAGDAELLRTSAGRAYLRIRRTRAAGVPQIVRP